MQIGIIAYKPKISRNETANFSLLKTWRIETVGADIGKTQLVVTVVNRNNLSGVKILKVFLAFFK